MITHVLGARPNFMKAAPVISALTGREALDDKAARPKAAPAGREQRVVHTGQHYDERMSDVFFRELRLPEPDVNLGVGSGSHAAQTAALMVALEKEFIERSPELVMVYGDVNSTIAAALVAAKLHIPVAHVEAGLRSFDLAMPEEVNRRLVDQLSALLFVTSPEGLGHLAAEGVPGQAHLVGNPMIDTLLGHDFDGRGLDLPERYVVATLHRPSNVDDPVSAAALVKRLHEIADEIDVVMPVHPRGRRTLTEAGLDTHERVHLLEPLGYVDFIGAVRGAHAVVTDSGGVQEETTMLGVPCLTVRTTTERPITITHGTNRLVTPDTMVAETLAAKRVDREPPPLWDGQSGPRIARIVEGWLGG